MNNPTDGNRNKTQDINLSEQIRKANTYIFTKPKADFQKLPHTVRYISDNAFLKEEK